MQATFTEAMRSDIDVLLELMADYYAYDHLPYDRQAARAALEELISDHSLGRVWVIRSGNDVAGYCVLTLGYSLEFRGRAAFVDELYVRDGYRGRGIGTKALQFLKETARALGVKALRLEVERKNADAHRLYETTGFESQDRDLMTNRLREDAHLA
jgi:GNAT superfamily N-acetyltransferase